MEVAGIEERKHIQYRPTAPEIPHFFTNRSSTTVGFISDLTFMWTEIPRIFTHLRLITRKALTSKQGNIHTIDRSNKPTAKGVCLKTYFKSRAVDPAEQFTTRIDSAYYRFFADYLESSSINHSLTKGEIRENPVRDFFESLLPGKFAVAAGEVMDSLGNVSPQSDMIIYRKSDGIPLLNQIPTILQVESVMCVTEVKSTISGAEYKDCLVKASKLLNLKPFNTPLQIYERGREPGPEECRIFTSIFAYGSDNKSSLRDEYIRYESQAKDLDIDPCIIDRIYILGKGVIIPSDKKYAEDRNDRKLGLFYFYSNLLQFIIRESKRRKEIPYIAYFGRMSEGWKRI